MTDETLKKFTRWIAIAGLIFGVFGFAYVGVQYMINPAPLAVAWGFEGTSPAAVTNLRVAIGAFHVAFGIVLLAALLRNKLIEGLFVFVVITSLAVGTRLAGLAIDGDDPATYRILNGERMSFIVAVIAFAALLFGRRLNKSDLESRQGS